MIIVIIVNEHREPKARMKEAFQIAKENTKKWIRADTRQRELKATYRVFRSWRQSPSEKLMT